MGMDLGALGAKVFLDTTQFNRGVKDVKSGFGNIQASIMSIDSALSLVGRAWGFFERNVLGTIGSFIEAADATEKYKITLESVLHSQSESARMFEEMAGMAAKSSREYDEIMASAAALSGVMKGGVDEVKVWMKGILDLSAVYNMSVQETTSNVIRLYSAGANSADLFREKGILAGMGLSQGVAVGVNESKKLMLEFMKTLDGADEKYGKTWSGLVSMMSDKWFAFRNQVMDSGGLFDNLKAAFQKVLDKIDELQKTGKLQEWADKVSAIFIKMINSFDLEKTLEAINSMFEKMAWIADKWEMILGMSLGSKVGAGIGTLLGIPGGPAGMTAGAALGSGIGGGIGFGLGYAVDRSNDTKEAYAALDELAKAEADYNEAYKLYQKSSVPGSQELITWDAVDDALQKVNTLKKKIADDAIKKPLLGDLLDPKPPDSQNKKSEFTPDYSGGDSGVGVDAPKISEAASAITNLRSGIAGLHGEMKLIGLSEYEAGLQSIKSETEKLIIENSDLVAAFPKEGEAITALIAETNKLKVKQFEAAWAAQKLADQQRINADVLGELSGMQLDIDNMGLDDYSAAMNEIFFATEQAKIGFEDYLKLYPEEESRINSLIAKLEAKKIARIDADQQNQIKEITDNQEQEKKDLGLIGLGGDFEQYNRELDSIKKQAQEYIDMGGAVEANAPIWQAEQENLLKLKMVAQGVADTFSAMGGAMANSLAEFAKSGKVNLGGLVEALGDILRMKAASYIAELLMTAAYHGVMQFVSPYDGIPHAAMASAALSATPTITALAAAFIGGSALSGMAHDGISNIPEDGTWLLKKGERVVDADTNADLKNMMGNGGGVKNISVNFYNSDEKGVKNSLPELKRVILDIVNGDISANGQTIKNIRAYG